MKLWHSNKFQQVRAEVGTKAQYILKIILDFCFLFYYEVIV